MIEDNVFHYLRSLSRPHGVDAPKVTPRAAIQISAAELRKPVQTVSVTWYVVWSTKLSVTTSALSVVHGMVISGYQAV